MTKKEQEQLGKDVRKVATISRKAIEELGSAFVALGIVFRNEEFYNALCKVNECAKKKKLVL